MRRQKNEASRRVVYMPTNRLCVSALRGRFAELAFAVDHNPETDIVFCLIENSVDATSSAQHAKILEDFARTSDIRVFHLTAASANNYISQLQNVVELDSAAMDSIDRLLRPPDRVSYGYGPNIATLFALSLGAEYLHRRDSDVYLAEANQQAMPLEQEIRYTGSEVRDAPTLRNAGAWSDTIAIVGTNTYGDATIDRAELIEAGADHLYDLQSLGRPGASRWDVAGEASEYLIVEPSVRYRSDFVALDYRNRVEMEAFCIAIAEQQCPEMPSDVIGCDYINLNLSRDLLKAIVYHSRKMVHRHEDDRRGRTSRNEFVDYALRDVNYLQMGRIFERVSKHVRHEAEQTAASFSLEHFGDLISRAVADRHEAVQDVRLGAADVYLRASHEARCSDGGREILGTVAKRILERGAQLDEHIERELETYCELLRLWPALTAAASATSLQRSIVRVAL